MLERRSLKWPIILGVVLIVLVILLGVGWVLLNVAGALRDSGRAGLYWALLSVGSVLVVCVLVGVILYLTLSIGMINLNRRQSNFIDSVTHELKSPIASLKLYLQTLSRREVSDRQRADFHRYMLSDVERLDQLINHLLDAGRVDRQDAHPAEPCRLDQTLRDCAQGVTLRHRQPPEVVEVDVPPALVVAPRVDLDILFRNLIDNAVKYGGDPPEVHVRMRTAGEGALRITVLDNGPGIPRAARRKVFGRFVRLGSELERSRPGTGLGLYLARTVARQLGGKIRSRDRHGRSGTEFEVILPGRLVDEETPAA